MFDHMNFARDTSAGGAVVVIIGGGIAAGTSHSSDSTAIFGIVAVALGTVYAAWAASRRLDKQLEAENVRHRQSLDAESVRLERQLASSRELVDVENLRLLFDDNAAAYQRSQSAMLELSVSRRSDHIDSGRSGELANEAVSAWDGVGIQRDRLEIRLPPDHLVLQAFTQLHEALEKRMELLMRAIGDEEPMADEQIQEDTQLARGVNQAFSAFADVARAAVWDAEQRAEDEQADNRSPDPRLIAETEPGA